MATNLTGLKVKDTYNSLLKIGDNSSLSATPDKISDGLGNESILYLSTSQVSIGTIPATGYDLTVNSATKTGSLDVVGAATAASLRLTGGSGSQGTLSWNTDEETVDIIQNGAVLQLGQEIHVHVKNQTGSTINDGTPVYVTGTLGSSGRLTVAPMIADGSIEAKYFLGVTTEDIPNGEDGKVTTFGKIRGLDTTAYTEGQTLYVSASTAGYWQTTAPVAPNLDLEVAIVINVSANNGTIFVRAQNGHYLGLLHDVYLNNVTANQVLAYNGTNNRWENSSDLSLGNLTLSGYLRGAANFVIDPAAHGDETGVVQILGDLRVDGTTTTINSTTVTIDDKNIVLASGSATAADANGAGITIDGANATMTYVSASDRFVFNKHVEAQKIIAKDGISSITLDPTLQTSNYALTIGVTDDGIKFQHNSNSRGFVFDRNGTELLNIASNGNSTFFGNVTAPSFIGSLTGAASLNVLKAGDTMTGHLNFNDSVEIKLGNSQDLRLWHNGTNSYLDNYTGALLIRNFANDQDIVLASDDGSGGLDDYIRIDGSEGSVNLYHYGSKKLETTSTGVSVTGALSGNISTSSISGGTIDINGTTAINLQYNGSTQLRIDSLGVAYLGTVTFANDGISLTDEDSTTDSFFHANVDYDAGLYTVTSNARYGSDYIQVDGKDSRSGNDRVFVISPKDIGSPDEDAILYLGGDNSITAPNTLMDWHTIEMNALSVQINNNEVIHAGNHTSYTDPKYLRSDTNDTMNGNLQLNGRITIATAAVPIIFNETGNTGLGQWWRHVLDAGNMRFDVSLSGGSSFTTYASPLRMKTNGDVKLPYHVAIGSTTDPAYRLQVIDDSPSNGIVADFVNSTNAGGTTAAIKLSNANSTACDVILGANRVGANFGSDFFISLSDGVDGTNQERFRITEAGLVGINQSSPSYDLDISGNTRTTGNLVGGNHYSTTGTYIFGSSSTEGEYIQRSGNDINFIVGGSNLLHLDGDNQRLGINTTSPRYQLDLAIPQDSTQVDYIALGVKNGPSGGGGTDLGSGLIWKANYSGYTKRSAGIVQIAESNYFQSGLAFYTNGTANTSTDWVQRMYLSSGGILQINRTNGQPTIKGSTTTGSAHLIIDSASGGDAVFLQNYNSGNVYMVTGGGAVGIGTTSPSSGHKLDVAGAATFDYNINVNGVDTNNPSAGTDQIRVSGYGIIGNRGTFYVTNGGGDVQIGNGSTHNSSPTASFASGGISLLKSTSVTGSVTFTGRLLKDSNSSTDTINIRAASSGQYLRLMTGNTGFGIADSEWSHTLSFSNLGPSTGSRAEIYQNATKDIYIGNTTYKSPVKMFNNLSMGIPGNGTNTHGRFISIEGNTASDGEGSGRIFFAEHNSTTAAMDNYGMSIGYRGGNTSITGASGNAWTGLSQIENGEWGMWGHDNNATGNLIMHGDRAATYVDFSGNNIQGANSITYSGTITSPSTQTRDKIRVWSGAPYSIGMMNGYTYGFLNNDYAMSFQMNSDNDRGFWWGDDGHSNAQGAMSLTTNGKLVVATSLSVGRGESVTSPGGDTLDVVGTAVVNNSHVTTIEKTQNIDSENLFNINDNTTVDELIEQFGGISGGSASYLSKVDDNTAPAVGCFELNGPVYFDAQGDYIKVDQNSDYTWEMWVKYVSGSDTDSRIYLGWTMYNSAKSSFGNVQRYWGVSGTQFDANSNNSGWYKISGTISGVGTGTGQFINGTEYAKTTLLLNYNGGSNVIRVCGFKLYRSEKRATELILQRKDHILVQSATGEAGNPDGYLRLFNYANSLQAQSQYGYGQFGPENASWCHIQTDRPNFYFNKGVIVDTGVIGSYDEDLVLVRANSTNDCIRVRSTNIGFILDGAEDMRLENDGDLHVESDVIAYSSTISDARLKDDVLTIDNALDKIKALRGVEYVWNKGGRQGQKDLGFIAQEVEEVIPEIVREKKMPLLDDTGKEYKTVDYEKVVAVLVEAMKEQQKQIDELKARLDGSTK